MPDYAGSGQAKLLRENTQAFLWQSESVVAGELSIAYQLSKVPASFYPYGLSFELVFSAAPGSFEVDIMGANTDIATNYIELGSITAVNASNVARWDMPSNLWPRYIAAMAKILTKSAVLVTLAVTR